MAKSTPHFPCVDLQAKQGFEALEDDGSSSPFHPHAVESEGFK